MQRQIGGASAAVAANYAYVLVAIPKLPTTFQFYLAVGTLTWMLLVSAPA